MVEGEGPPLWGCGDVGVADDGMYCVVVAPGEARGEGFCVLAGVTVRAWRSAQRFLSVGWMCVAEVSARSLPETRWALIKIPSMRERETVVPCWWGRACFRGYVGGGCGMCRLVGVSRGEG